MSLQDADFYDLTKVVPDIVRFTKHLRSRLYFILVEVIMSAVTLASLGTKQ